MLVNICGLAYLKSIISKKTCSSLDYEQSIFPLRIIIVEGNEEASASRDCSFCVLFKDPLTSVKRPQKEQILV